MKFKLLSLVTLCVGLSTFSLQANAIQGPGIVVVNYDALIQSSKAYQDSLAQFKKDFASKDKEVVTLQQKLESEDKAIAGMQDKLKADLAASKVVGKELQNRQAQIQKRIEGFQKLHAEYQQKAAVLQQEMQQYQAQAISQVEVQVRNIVQEYGKANNVQLILDGRSAIYSDGSLDITRLLIDKVK